MSEKEQIHQFLEKRVIYNLKYLLEVKQAFSVISEFCVSEQNCNNCPMKDVCKKLIPESSLWIVGELGAGTIEQTIEKQNEVL